MMEQKSAIEELILLTSFYKGRPDQVQGPGGNTSVKDSEGNMYIKASGFRFEELTVNKGISAVKAGPVKKWFFSHIPGDKNASETQMLEIISEHTLLMPGNTGMKYPKPSMETGFHAILGKYVVHTHSVWSNLMNCAEDKESVLERLALETGLRIASIPFVSPGLGLSYMIADVLKSAESNGKPVPEVFVLFNHGIVSHAEDMGSCMEALTKVDRALKAMLSEGQSYPDTAIELVEGVYRPVSGFVTSVLAQVKADDAFFTQVMFPDQIVFFSEQISFGKQYPSRRIQIGEGYKVEYNASERDALNAHETLTAYLFLYDRILASDRKPHFIDSEEIDYINNMEMEKFRRKDHFGNE